MAASTDTLLIFLRYPDKEKRQSLLTLGMYFESVCSLGRTQKIINTQSINICLTEDTMINMKYRIDIEKKKLYITTRRHLLW